MLGTRAFRSGDSLRRVHWAQTARQQQMIVCERQAPATTSVRVTLDIDSASHPNVVPDERDPQSSLELAVEVAASVCESLHRQHCRVELSLHDQLLVAGESATSFQRLMDVLSQTTPADQRSDARSRNSVRRRHESQSFNILITTPHGVSSNGFMRNGQHVISLSDSGNSPATSPVSSTHGSWISLGQSADAGLDLQRKWKDACNVR